METESDLADQEEPQQGTQPDSPLDVFHPLGFKNTVTMTSPPLHPQRSQNQLHTQKKGDHCTPIRPKIIPARPRQANKKTQQTTAKYPYLRAGDSARFCVRCYFVFWAPTYGSHKPRFPQGTTPAPVDQKEDQQRQMYQNSSRDPKAQIVQSCSRDTNARDVGASVSGLRHKINAELLRLGTPASRNGGC